MPIGEAGTVLLKGMASAVPKMPQNQMGFIAPEVRFSQANRLPMKSFTCQYSNAVSIIRIIISKMLQTLQFIAEGLGTARLLLDAL